MTLFNDGICINCKYCIRDGGEEGLKSFKCLKVRNEITGTPQYCEIVRTYCKGDWFVSNKKIN